MGFRSASGEGKSYVGGMATSGKLLVLRGVGKSFRGPTKGDRPLLRWIHLEVQEEETVALLGPTGAGKTTLLRLIAGLEQPSKGEPFLLGQRLDGLSEKKRAVLRNRLIGFVFPQPRLFPQYTVWENLLLPTLVCRNEAIRDSAPARAEHLLKRMDLWDHRHRWPQELSLMDQQRVAFVRALMNEPVLVLADEPTAWVDESLAIRLVMELLELCREMRAALILATDSIEVAGRCRTLYRLRQGELVRIQPQTYPSNYSFQHAG